MRVICAHGTLADGSVTHALCVSEEDENILRGAMRQLFTITSLESMQVDELIVLRKIVLRTQGTSLSIELSERSMPYRQPIELAAPLAVIARATIELHVRSTKKSGARSTG